MYDSAPIVGSRRYIAATLRSHWLLFVLVGVLLLIAGFVAIAVPALSSIEPNELLGLVLAFVGIVQIVQSGKMQGETLFIWHLAFGLLTGVGGVLVYLNPFPSVMTILALMAIVFAIHGLTQIAFGISIRQLDGWYWFVISGFIALLVAGLLVMKLPYSETFKPASAGGVSLLFAGWAYLRAALASRT